MSAPVDLARAASTGLQNRLQANTPRIAAAFFRQGHASFGGNPMSDYLSDGPIIDHCTMEGWNTNSWTLSLKAHSEAPITDISIRDQQGLCRSHRCRWRAGLPLGVAQPAAALRQHPLHGSPELVLPPLLARHSYTCATVTPGVAISVPGVQLADAYSNKLSSSCTSPIYIHDNSYDSTYVPGARDRTGDSRPFWLDLAIPEFAASARFVSVMHRRSVADRQYIVTVRLKQSLTPQGTVWPITSTVRSPAAISGLKALLGEVTVPAGGTVLLDLRTPAPEPAAAPEPAK